MLKKHMAACLVTTALLAAPALAQTSSTSGSGASSAASSGKFLSEEKPNQWRASKLVGVDVYGPNKEKVGDINEVLIDRNGKAEAVVIGVGGFLGIGEKDVAVPFDQVRWSDNPSDVRGTAATGTGAPGTGASGTGATATTGTAGSAGTAGTAGGAGGMAGGAGTGTAGTGAGATTGSTGTAGAARTDAASTNRGYPDHGMISMTKEELNSAPSFRYAGSTSRDNTGAAGTRPAGTGASGMGTTGAGTAAPGSPAPRQ